MNGTWRLNPRVSNIPLRAAWLGCTAVVILSTQSIIFPIPDANFLFWTIEIITYLGITAKLIAIYRRNTKIGHNIVITAESLYVPRIFRKSHKIPIREINSLETFANKKEIFGLLVGRSRKTSIFIDKRIFSKDIDFNNFVDLLSTLTTAARSDDASRVETMAICARRQATPHSLLAFISLTLLATYLSYCDDFHHIGELAVAHGALIKGSLAQGDWYRIGSSFFLHSSPMHLGLNVVSLALVGRNIEVILGSCRLINILLLSAIAGALSSLIFSPHEAVVGASGGILGLYGAYFLISLKYNRRLPGSVSTSNLNLTLALVSQLLFDATVPRVDGSSHIGGFLLGFGYAFAVTRGNLSAAAKPSWYERVMTAVVASIFAYTLLRLALLSIS
jgi:membrane associated rhomboid family serine protease